jgi:hypothetical protein
MSMQQRSFEDHGGPARSARSDRRWSLGALSLLACLALAPSAHAQGEPARDEPAQVPEAPVSSTPAPVAGQEPAPTADPQTPAQNPVTPTTTPPTTPPAAPPPAATPDATTAAPALAPNSAPAAATPPAPSAPARIEYHDLAAIAALFAQWTTEHPGVVRPLAIGKTVDGRNVPALEFGAAGGLALEERPTVLLLGGLDGVSLAGGEAVLMSVSELLRESGTLPAGVCFIAVPWASPEALEMCRAGRAMDGRNARPFDEDRDGLVDEDGPDDLDGDGLALQMLIEDPAGPWARAADPRFLVRADQGLAPRYILTREGRDDDGDGRYNEDGPGGVVLDQNFPVGRLGPWTGELNGVLPMSEELARSLAQLGLARRIVAALFFQGNHGLAAAPGGVCRAFAPATGRRQSGLVPLCAARGGDRRGAALDWFYAVPGALSLEIAPWGPAIDGGAEASPQDARYSPKNGAFGARPPPSEQDRAWANWLDDKRGGLGFNDWHPVELGNGVQGLVGGWEPNTQLNPPPESLPAALNGIPTFVRGLAASLPALEIRADASRDGDVCRVRARIKNTGALPTGLAVSASRPGAAALVLVLELPAGARLLAGRESTSLVPLVGGELSPEREWIVLAPAGSTFTLRAKCPWTLDAAREVKP